jgi:hypothetical protein
MTAQKSFKPIVSLLLVTLLVVGFFAVGGQVYAAEDVALVSESVVEVSVVSETVVEQVAPVAVVENADVKAVEEVTPNATNIATPASFSAGVSGSVVLAGTLPEVVSAEVTTTNVPVAAGVEVVSVEVGSGSPAIMGIEVVSSEIVAATANTTGGGGNPQPASLEVVGVEVTAITTVANTGVEVVSTEVSATTYSSTIPPPGLEVVSNEVAATTLAAGPEVISEEVTVRTSDAPSGGCTSNCGGGGSTPSTPSGGGGGGYIVPPDFAVEDDLPTTCSEYLLEYIRLGWANNPLEVVKLQVFLNYFEGFNLPITGVYTLADFNAVSIFQARYGRDILGPWGIDDSTGFVFITTRMAINNIVCHLSTENNLDLRNFYLQAAARLGLNVPATVPPAYVPTNVGVGTSTPATWIGRFQAAMVGLFNYFQNNGGWRLIGFLLILLALFILIWRLSRNVLDDDFDNDGDDIGGDDSPLLLPPVFFDEQQEEKDQFVNAGDEIEEVVIPSSEEEVDAVVGEEAPAANEPMSEYAQRPLDNLR